MTGRTARVGNVNLISAGLGSIVQFGDIASFTPASRALAVQRELDHRIGGEVYFKAYPMFWQPPIVALASDMMPESESDSDDIVDMTTSAPGGGIIEVGSIRVISVTAASMLQTGNNGAVAADSRIKHFRQFAFPRTDGR